jgi:hypothetical protein
MTKNAYTYKAPLAMTAAAAALLGLVGCGSSGSQPTASSSGATSQGTTSQGATASNSAGSGAGGSTSAAAGTPEAALSAWVTDIVEGDYLAACTKMAVSANGTATGTPTPGTPALCTKASQTGAVSSSPETLIKDLHPSFTPKSLSGQPSVAVSPVSASGSTVTVDAKQVSIDGTPLNQVIVANSTGVSTSDVQVTFSLTRLGGTWYVSNFNLNV